jgi:mono/diheme cytochrome c family protein
MQANAHSHLARRGAAILLALFLSACGGGGSGSSGGGSSLSTQALGPASSLSYHEHTRSIIDSRCVTCHREGGQAPFSLDGYSRVAAKRSAIAYVLESGSMPVPGFAKLSGPERELLMQWLDEGAAEGRPRDAAHATPYTYYGDVKSIIDKRCANCHSPGEIAPFSLNDYDSVYSVRAAIAHQVETGAMPPWPPTDHYLPLRNKRSLGDEERAVLLSWIDGGAPAGDPAEHVPDDRQETPIDYQLTVRLNEPYTPTERPDEYRCLLIDWPLEHTVYVDAVRVVPDAKAEVHHVFAVVMDPDELGPIVAADGVDGKPGFPCWGAPSPEGSLLPPRTLTVWAPRISPGYLPGGTRIRVDPGSKIIMQMHYNTINTEPVPDQSSLEIHYVDEVEREAITLFFLDVGWYGPGGMPIPANDPSVTHQYTGHFGFLMNFSGAGDIGISDEEPFALHSAFMHQHVLGKSTSIELIREDGTELMLLDIRDWDFDWQDEYVFEDEVIMYPEDKLRLTCTWDNSAANQQFVNARQLAPQYVEFGEGTVDEMCVNYFYVTRAKEEDLEEYQDFPPTVAFHQPRHLQRFKPGDYVPIELLVNAFRLQEPNSSHSSHGHMDTEEVSGGGGHGHRTGHYHIYLDSEDDSADHLTQWDASTFYQLPDDIVPGRHTLRVSLRDDDHQPLGIEDRVTFVVEEASGESAVSLIDVKDWQPQGAAQDVFASHRPASVNCPPNAWHEEDGALEVETGYCNYLSLGQPGKTAIRKGDSIHLVLWHAQLRNDEPADAHVAVSVGGNVVFDREVRIPSAGGIYDVVIPATEDMPEGEAVEFHLHNHGYNTWTLLTLEVQR